MPHKTYKINGRTLRKLMEENSMSPSELAEKMEINYSTVINWRKGSNTDQGRIQRLAKILDCDPNVLTSKRDPRVNGGASDDISKIQEHIKTGNMMCAVALGKNMDQKVGSQLGKLISFFNRAEEILSE